MFPVIARCVLMAIMEKNVMNAQGLSRDYLVMDMENATPMESKVVRF